MKMNETTIKNLVKIGCWLGISVVVMYLVPKLISLPGFLSTAFFIYQGPFLIVAFIGLYYYFSKKNITISVLLGALSGILGGILRMLMSVIQMTNLVYIREHIKAAETPEAEQIWKNILSGVFTVQNGFGYVMDFFIDWSIILFSIAMWNHPKFGKIFSLFGLAIAGSHFLMKAYTFPKPPAEAGLFDIGPFVSLWALIIFIWVLIKIKWLDEVK